MLKLAHIVNPVIVNSQSDLWIAQPITFETMKLAQLFAQPDVDVTLYSAQYPEDRAFVPDHLQKTPDLERSVLDIRTFQKSRKLPLIQDILDRLHTAATQADYLIYTNVDIALMPHFYLAVARLIHQGFDALVINRQTISKTYSQIADLPLMYAEVGKPHGGHDCFIFRRSVYPKYNLGTACIGAAKIGKVMLVNLMCHAQQFVERNDLHLTFHLGNDRTWKSPDLIDYFEHNETELIQLLQSEMVRQAQLNHPQMQKLMEQYQDFL